MAPDNRPPSIIPPERTPERSSERLRGRDWAVAIGLGLVLLLIVAAIFRNGLAYLYG